MITLPCHGCRCKADPNCIEDCVSHNVWAKKHYRALYKSLFYEEKTHFIADSENYYEPCDETGEPYEPYKKGDLDKKMGKWSD